MNIKRIATLSAAGAVLAAMIAGATTSGGRHRPNRHHRTRRASSCKAPNWPQRSRVPRTGCARRINQEPARNLFHFGARVARGSLRTGSGDRVAHRRHPPPPPARSSGSRPKAPPAPPSSPGSAISSPEGDRIAGQHRVSRVDGDGVDVTSLSDGSTVTLRLDSRKPSN
jgi:hypothetical protein